MNTVAALDEIYVLRALKGLNRDPIQGEVTVFWNPYGTQGYNQFKA